MGDRPTNWFVELLKGGIGKIKAEVAEIGVAHVEKADVAEADIGEATIGTLGFSDLSGSSVLLTTPDSSYDLGATLGEWVGVGTNTAAVVVEAESVTDGTDTGAVSVAVDEKSTGSEDYSLSVSEAHSALGDGASETGTVSFVLPPDSQIKVSSDSDPAESNAINTARALEL